MAVNKPMNRENHKGFVDHIIRDMLHRPKGGMSPDLPPNAAAATGLPDRPNYQRQKSQERLICQSQEATSGLPTGALLAMAMKPGTPPEKQQAPLPPAASPAQQMSNWESSRQPLGKIPGGDAKSRTQTVGQAQIIGVAAGYTLGYVIPNMDQQLRRQLSDDPAVRAVGVISSRQGAAAQIMAADEAVKKTGASLLRLELARDDNGGTGHGVLVLLASPDVADVTKAVEIALAAVDEYQKNISVSPAGKIETHYSARSAAALTSVFGVAPDQAVGILIGAPAGVGLLMSDTALKTARVETVAWRGPAAAQAFANESWLVIAGEPAAVRNALDAGRLAGETALAQLAGQGG